VGEIARIAPAFAFELPPYFLNNARALASLEGLARAADPTFSIVASVYPFALTTLLADKSGSPLLRRTLDDLATDPETDTLSLKRMRTLVTQLAELSRKRKARVYWDVLCTRGGRRLARQWAGQQGARVIGRAARWVRGRSVDAAPSFA
jgi:predicted unusual protein kinase regulating ubiquinone biosynthesis (AarF/ABC1/UbiB family)